MTTFGFSVFLLLIAVISSFVLKRSKNAARRPLPPGPIGLPILGYLPFLGDNLQEKFAELADAYGPIYKLWLGRKLYVVVSSPALVKEIVREKDLEFANRDPNIAARILSYGGKDIAFANYGSYWRTMRKLFVKEVMSTRSLEACYDLRLQTVRKSVSEVYQMVGSPIDIGELALRTMIGSVITMLWGISIGREKGDSVNSEFKTVMVKLMELVSKPNVSDFFPVLSRLDLQGIARQAREVNLRFDRFLDSIIRSATEGEARRLSDHPNRDQRKDLLQLLLALEIENEDGTPRTASNNQEIKGILMDIVIGGTDTTAAMVEWVMAELLHHKDAMEKVMEQLTEVVGVNSMVQEHCLPKLKYLEAVVKETFRLHPALPLVVPRSPDSSCVVGGYTIPKGSTVFLNAAYIHTDPKLWDKPLDFVPERFLEDPSEYDFSGNNFVYLPFGSGRRICPGLPLAEKMLMFMLANFLHSFHWELPEGTELEFSNNVGIVSKKSRPLVVIPRPRLMDQELYK
ncbi:hypothetical protein MLD38_018741 [Melastoma candidum]|uniref:Uncharacterized protein n=1 Tax=Melastoma candidum TaxID=119954 RepID=A0ACB9QYS9_9MYRT|nr:hypothetical protein MLD38_018741 [Melastoma candidum]